MHTSKLEAVKELLFGQNMKDYEKEFQDLNAHINQNKEKFDEKLSEIKANFHHSMSEINDKFNHRMNDLEHRIMEELAEQKHQQIDKVQLAKIFKGLGIMLHKD